MASVIQWTASVSRIHSGEIRHPASGGVPADSAIPAGIHPLMSGKLTGQSEDDRRIRRDAGDSPEKIGPGAGRKT
jgi:hypothetical protein